MQTTVIMIVTYDRKSFIVQARGWQQYILRVDADQMKRLDKLICNQGQTHIYMNLASWAAFIKLFTAVIY